jgi:hypothetical protein
MFRIVSLILRWVARIAAVLIAAIFFAFIVGEPVGSLRAIDARDWVGMVLLFVCIAAMLATWKWEFPAALVSLFALGAFAAVVRMNRYDVLVVAAMPNCCSFWTGSCVVCMRRTPKTRACACASPRGESLRDAWVSISFACLSFLKR